MPRLPWLEARHRRPYPATQRFWSSDGMATRLPSKARTVSCAPWSEGGWAHSMAAANFWNPKLRGPLCFNPPGARSVLPLTYKRTEMILAGKSKAQVIDALKAAYEKKELPPLEPGAMSYMMSKDQYLTDDVVHSWMGHLRL